MREVTVAIVGRPNVGKSTLFNRIVGRRHAIVDDKPGVTRDRNFGKAEWNGRGFWLVDTGGWIAGSNDTIDQGIREQVSLAVAEADAVLFVVDTQAGIHPADREVAEVLRPIADRVLVVANKADELADELDHHAFHELGLGEPQPTSASTGRGSGDLLDRLCLELSFDEQEADGETVAVAIIGRPNVGKSSITNRLLGSERTIVAAEAGTTRDAVDSPLRFHGKTLNFIDTAGLRKRLKVKDDIEFYSNLRTERAMDRADVCVLVVDGTHGVQVQDLRIAQQAWEKGTGLVIAVNKWDLVEDKDTNTADRGRRELVEKVPFLARVPFLFVSAMSGQRVRKLLDQIVAVADARKLRKSTSEVNQTLEKLVARNQPPQKPGREVKLFYATQIGVAPPSFAVVSNRPDALPESYRRYIVNGFYDAWGFVGTPLRVKIRRKRSRGSSGRTS